MMKKGSLVTLASGAEPDFPGFRVIKHRIKVVPSDRNFAVMNFDKKKLIGRYTLRLMTSYQGINGFHSLTNSSTLLLGHWLF